MQLAREGRCVEFGAFSFRGHTIVVIVDREAVSGAKAWAKCMRTKQLERCMNMKINISRIPILLHEDGP